MKVKVMKKIFAALIIIAMFVPYFSGMINASIAADDDWREYSQQFNSGAVTTDVPTLDDVNKVENWHEKVKSFQYFAYKMGSGVIAKWLFYDVREGSKFQNINCIRSGNSQDETYIMHDLYHLKEDKPELYEELFNGPNNLDADRNYQHVLWEIENFYLFDENDTPEQKQAKFDEYNAFIGASSVPFAADEMAEIQLYELDSGGVEAKEKVKNLTKNEVLVKTLQNETLLSFVKQTSRLTSEVPPIKIVRMVNGRAVPNAQGKNIYDDLSAETNEYVGKIVSKFKTLENSADYNSENINKYFNRNPELAKVQLRSDDTTADPTNNKSGSFFVQNKFNANITGVKVYRDGTLLNSGDYRILNSANEDVTDTITSLLKNSASASEYEFKIEDSELSNGTHTVEVEVNVDYGYIISATLFEPVNKALDNSNKGCQYVININKDYRTDVLRAGVETEVPKYFDFALTKQIVNAKATVDNDKSDAIYQRLEEIDTYSLNQGDSTTARYVMNKKPVRVEPGDIVTYKLTVYNEGQLDGFAEEITDYLPEELSLVEPETVEGVDNINKEYGWVADSNNPKIIRTTYLSSNNNINSANKIKAYNGVRFTGDNKKEIYLQCRVTDSIPDLTNSINTKIVDNRAEISRYGHYAKDYQDNDVFVEANYPGNDRDSLENTALSNAHTDNVQEMIEQIETTIRGLIGWNETNDDKAKTDYEDDDDIERIMIVQDSSVFDLALRKWIEKVDDTDYDRAPIQLKAYQGETVTDQFGKEHDLLRYAQQSLRLDTFDYDNPKEAVELYPGALVTYRIGIFNEGTISGYAEEITDYLPSYLEFVEDNEINRQYGWEGTRYNNGTTIVKTKYFSRANGTETTTGENSNMISYPLKAYTEKGVSHREDALDAYRTIPIVCRVKADAPNEKYLTNRAEITEYGYINKADEFVTANAVGIDEDSEQNTIRDNLNLDTWYESNYVSILNQQTPQINFPGEQDDDDFETVLVKVSSGNYSIRIKKVSEDDSTKTIAGAVFTLKVKTASSILRTSNPTGEDGIAALIDNVRIAREGKDEYIINETSVPAPYKAYEGDIELTVAKKLVNGVFVLDEENTKVNGKNVELDINNNVITIIVPNPEREFDLALRKFITSVNGSKLEGDDSRAPKIDFSTLINGDPKKNGEKTATYVHTKEPVVVNPTDIVEYTLRVYNEGEIDGYASRIIDDVPAGVTMVAPEYDTEGKPLNTNAEYRWVMFREMTDADKDSSEIADKAILRYDDKLYVETANAEEAVLISTDYLSYENGLRRMAEEEKEENPNLIKAFDGSRLYHKSIKVEFKVKQARTDSTIITNYAQISEHQGPDGTTVTDRDSTPNVWKDKEDDQDIENLKVNWFDLALYKWVSSTIVTEDGKTKEYESGHTQDDKDKVVNVTVAKDKLDKTVVKFKWTIKVENQSPIPGYATELKDHVPAGLKFVEEDNKDFGWKLQKDGTVTTDYLKNTLLNQGETAEVTLILTWVNGENNLGAKVNYAEISEDFNAYGAPDIDSTPDNFTGKPIEDDEDADEVRLNIKTGMGLIAEYIAIALGVLVIITTGTILVKKQVIDKEF